MDIYRVNFIYPVISIAIVIISIIITSDSYLLDEDDVLRYDNTVDATVDKNIQLLYAD